MISSTFKTGVVKVIKKVDKYGFLLRSLRFFATVVRACKFWLIWREKPYSQFYSARQDKLALEDPKVAVGGRWEELGKLQFDFLLDKGLQPQHRLLDLGCGSLRAGLWFIRYLECGNYYGMDISPNIIEAGRRFLIEAGLESHEPHLTVNYNLKFEGLSDVTFDYIIAQSVFTHMPGNDIEECFANLHGILKRSGVFYASFNEGKSKWDDKVKTNLEPFILCGSSYSWASNNV